MPARAFNVSICSPTKTRLTGVARVVVLACICLVILAAPRAAWAFNFFELEAYPATTPPRGAHELGSFTTFVANGRRAGEDADQEDGVRSHRLLRSSLEYDYGLTDRLEAGARLDLEKPNGRDLKYAGARLRARGAIWDPGRFPVDLGWYLEAEAPHNVPADFELASRLIVSRRIGRFSVRLNPIFEFPVLGGERRTVSFSYAAGTYAALARHLRVGVEFFGGLGQIRAIDSSRDQQHYVFPVVEGRLLRRLSINVGPGFGFTRGSEAVILKLAVEYGLSAPPSISDGRGHR